MRAGWGLTLGPGGRWPDNAGGREMSPFKYIRWHHRTLTAVGQVVVCLDGPSPSNLDDDRAWDLINPGDRRTRNVGGVNDSAADDLHFLNTDANVTVTLYVEISDTPIVDFESAHTEPMQLQDGGGGTANLATVLAAGQGDGIAQGNAIEDVVHLYAYNGSTWDRVRTINQLTAQQGAVSVGDVSAFNVETTAALGSSATFTGPWRDGAAYNWLGAYAVSDQTFTLFTDEADQSTPNVINQVSTQASAAAPAANNPGGQFARVVPTKTVLRFVRIRVVNGATAQTRLNVQSSLSPLN